MKTAYATGGGVVEKEGRRKGGKKRGKKLSKLSTSYQAKETDYR